MVLVLSDSSKWVYFNKGKANCLYKYTGDDDYLKNKLLRLRLQDQVFTSKKVYNYTENVIRPVMEEVISMELVKVCFEIPGMLNDGYGLLMPNILPDNIETVRKEKYFKTYKNQTQFILELKPKWLSNEGDACRNCAHHRLKFGFYSDFCSLDLLNENTLPPALSLITEDLTIQKSLLSYFSINDNVLRKLQKLQKTSQVISEIKSESDVTDQLCTAMTLRDVTIFFIIEANKVQKVIVTDTDPKGRSKWKYWVSTEQKLIQNGYYQSNSKHH